MPFFYCSSFHAVSLVLALINSFKTNRELLVNVMSLPDELHFENYQRTFEKMNYLRSF